MIYIVFSHLCSNHQQTVTLPICLWLVVSCLSSKPLIASSLTVNLLKIFRKQVKLVGVISYIALPWIKTENLGKKLYIIIFAKLFMHFRGIISQKWQWFQQLVHYHGFNCKMEIHIALVWRVGLIKLLWVSNYLVRNRAWSSQKTWCVSDAMNKQRFVPSRKTWKVYFL